jgi:hypothetical protein
MHSLKDLVHVRLPTCRSEVRKRGELLRNSPRGVEYEHAAVDTDLLVRRRKVGVLAHAAELLYAF